MTTEAKAAALLEEVRRLRLRVTSLTSRQLDEGRRAVIRESLVQLSDLRADGRAVPQLEDRILADQVVVLLTDCLPEYGATEDQTARALAIAQGLRRALA